jgi:hypothetical protein
VGAVGVAAKVCCFGAAAEDGALLLHHLQEETAYQ